MGESAEFYKKGGDAFNAEDYETAIEFYSKALELDVNNTDGYLKRCQAYYKAAKYQEMKDDAEKVLALDDKNGSAYLKKGIALYHLKKLQEALEVFEKGQQLEGSDESFMTWIETCKTDLSKTATNVDQPPQVKIDWYQTESQVVISVMLKNLKNEDCEINFSSSTLNLTARRPGTSDYKLEMELAHPIVPEACTWKVLSTKIEIKLKKKEGIRWSTMEKTACNDKPVAQSIAKDPSSAMPKYPSHTKRDWDKIASDIAKEDEEEKLEGDAALNQLFQKIYSQGNDEVRRAMNKSFVESGGTVLSTNWKEVGDKKVDVKPPDGTEFRSWEK